LSKEQRASRNIRQFGQVRDEDPPERWFQSYHRRSDGTAQANGVPRKFARKSHAPAPGYDVSAACRRVEG
jgi:hypothetical protein